MKKIALSCSGVRCSFSPGFRLRILVFMDDNLLVSYCLNRLRTVRSSKLLWRRSSSALIHLRGTCCTTAERRCLTRSRLYFRRKKDSVFQRQATSQKRSRNTYRSAVLRCIWGMQSPIAHFMADGKSQSETANKTPPQLVMPWG